MQFLNYLPLPFLILLLMGVQFLALIYEYYGVKWLFHKLALCLQDREIIREIAIVAIKKSPRERFLWVKSNKSRLPKDFSRTIGRILLADSIAVWTTVGFVLLLCSPAIFYGLDWLI